MLTINSIKLHPFAMSNFEDYDKVSTVYDNVRVADGVESMVMMLCALLKKPPNKVSYFH